MSDWETLENLASKAHRDGQPWPEFWKQHADRIRAAEPWNMRRFHRLRERLMHILLTGETSGQYAAGDDDAAPGEADDTAWQPNDTRTEARLSREWCLAGEKAEGQN